MIRPSRGVSEGYNHFEIQEMMGNLYGLLGRALE